jgi:molybdenum cofactor cytidylyltransferase
MIGLGPAVILAGGAGSRFVHHGHGGPIHKLLAPFRGRPLIWWAVTNAVAAGLDEVIVIDGAVSLADTVGHIAGVRVVSNPAWATGQASSLLHAVTVAEAAGYSAVTVGLGDQPFLDPAAWRAVAATTIAPIAVAVVGGRRGQPVRLAAEVWSVLPTSGDEGARSLLVSKQFPVAELGCPGNTVDIDTQEDLRAWS